MITSVHNGKGTAMVTREISPNKELSTVVPTMELVGIRNLVIELANKHHFDLGRPGYVLWLQAPKDIHLGDDPRLRIQPLGDLAICVTAKEYILGLSKSHGPGFKVHYSRDWVPQRAFNNSGCPYRNLASANLQMYRLLSRYRYSDFALVTELFWENNISIENR